MLIHNADITGSLTINGVPYNTGSFTGSFYGDGSQLSGVTSYTNADTLAFIQGYSGSYSGSFSGSFFGDGSNLSGVTSYTDADTLAFINSLDVVSGSIQTVSTVSDTFTSATSYTVTHNFGTKEVIVSVYENDTLIFPSSITTPTTNTVTITFPEPVTGRVVVVKAGHIVSGSINYNSVLNKPTLVSGSSQISFTGITNKPTLVSGSSQITYSGLTGIPSGIVSGSSQIAQFGYATTGSNQFKASQTITGSLTVTGAIVAQTLNVQQVTSSIVYSSGSNIFGNSLSDTQQFTGSVGVTGSLTVAGAGTFTGALNGSSAVFNSTVSATQYTATSTGGSGLRVYGAAGTNQWDIYLNSTNLRFSDNTGTGNIVFDRPLNGTTASFKVNADRNLAIKYDTNITISGQADSGGPESLRIYADTFRIYTSTTAVGLTERFTISNTGAATFSSSVTAASGLINGTTNAFFDLNRNASGSAGRVRFQTAGTDEFQIGLKGGVAGFHITKGDATELVTVLTGGNVGIGTATPGRLFEIASGGDTAFLRVTGNRGNADGIHVGNIEFYNSNTSRLVGEVRGITGTGGTQSNSGQLAFYTNDNGTYAERMRITSGGNVVIGGSTAGTSLNTSLTVNNSSAGNYAGLIAMTADVQRGYYGGTSTGLEIGVSSTGYLSVWTNGSERMRITSDGYARLSASSGGIQFNGDTAAANALDDYEEGTFTPTMTFGGGSTGITYFDRIGNYTKVGRHITCTIYLALTSKGSSTGNAQITGLPFAASGANRGTATAGSIRFNSISFVGRLGIQGQQSGTVIDFGQTTEAGVATSLTNSDFSDSSEMFITITYFTA